MISGSTGVVGVIGDPVGHSLSPIIHNAAFGATGLDWVYVAFPVPTASGSMVVSAMKTLGIRGLSVTMPHKDFVAAYADEVSGDVGLLGAANTLILLEDGRVRAETTDGDGCIASLLEGGCNVAGKRCVVLGAGGTGRAVVLALARARAQSIVVVNRSPDRAAAAAQLGRDAGAVCTLGDQISVTDAEVIINATSVGMGHQTLADSELVIPPDLLHKGQFVQDLIYFPLKTAFLIAAEKQGATVIGGIGMLIHQAARQFTLWTGEEAPIEVMQLAVHEELARRAQVNQ